MRKRIASLFSRSRIVPVASVAAATALPEIAGFGVPLPLQVIAVAVATVAACWADQAGTQAPLKKSSERLAI